MSSEHDSKANSDDIGAGGASEGAESARPSAGTGPTSLLATMRSSQDEISAALFEDVNRAARGPSVQIEEASDADEPASLKEKSSTRSVVIALLFVLAFVGVAALWWFTFSSGG